MKIKKSDLNQNIHLSEGNIKSKGTDDTMFLTWSLPSRTTCPYATETCKKRCFARKNESFQNVRDSRNRNLVEEYFKKWVDITEHFSDNPKILFQAYTKSMPIIMDYMNWYQNEYDCRYGTEDYEFFMQTINIHFVWSIWHDTPEEYTELAYLMDMQTFTALPKEEIDDAVKEGAFLCEGDCGNCKECYTGKSKEIVIPYH